MEEDPWVGFGYQKTRPKPHLWPFLPTRNDSLQAARADNFADLR